MIAHFKLYDQVVSPCCLFGSLYCMSSVSMCGWAGLGTWAGRLFIGMFSILDCLSISVCILHIVMFISVWVFAFRGVLHLHLAVQVDISFVTRGHIGNFGSGLALQGGLLLNSESS